MHVEKILCCKRSFLILVLWGIWGVGCYSSQKVVEKNSVKQLDDIWVKDGFGFLTMQLERLVAFADGKRESLGASNEKLHSKKKVNSKNKKNKTVVLPAFKISASDQKAFFDFAKRYSNTLLGYSQRDQGKLQSTHIFEVGAGCLVDAVRTALFTSEDAKIFIKEVFPILGVRPYDAREEQVWGNIRPLLGMYLGESSVGSQLHPLQDEALDILRESFAKLKDAQVHPFLIKKFNAVVMEQVLFLLAQKKQAGLSKLPALEKLNLYLDATQQTSVLDSKSKMLIKAACDPLVALMTTLNAQASLVSTQLQADATSPEVTRIKNAFGYMNKIDSLLGEIKVVDYDLFADQSIIVLRNKFAQVLVELEQKLKLKKEKNLLLPLLHRSVDSGLLGRAQRLYVKSKMLPALDATHGKKHRNRLAK